MNHPEYRYPQSRNPYWSGLRKIGESGVRPNAYADNGAEQFRGSWRERFPVDSFPQINRVSGVPGGEVIAASLTNPSGAKASSALASTIATELCVEIGCNAGHVTVEWAAANPQRAYVGIDWKHKAVFRAAEKAAKRGLSNAIFVRGNAERLAYLFGPGEVDRLSIFFPDPWPKISQWKNRTLTAERLREFASIMRPRGLLHIKTDHAGYFDWIEEAAANAGECWKVAEKSRDLHRGHPRPQSLKIPEVTLFEKLFIKDGIPIKSLLLEKIGG